MGKYASELKNELSLRSTRDSIYPSNPQRNLFGTIADNRLPIAPNIDFIPANGVGDIIDLVNGSVIGGQWLGLDNKQMQFWAYVYCAPLASVIERLAEADTNGKMHLIDEDQIVIKKKSWMNSPKKKRIMQLLKRPNPIQTWEEFNSQQVVWCKIFGYCPVFFVCPPSMDKSYTKWMFNLNPYYAFPNYIEDETFDYRNPKNPIKSWSFEIFGKKVGEIPSSEVLVIREGYVDAPNSFLPLSKVAGMDYAVSNICAAMEADNVLLKKKGPLGVFSYDMKPDMAGATPLMPKQKDELQRDLSKYGLSWNQLQYVISKFPVKWNPMSFNAKDLMTKETTRQAIDMICDRLGYPAELMSGKNATYENRTSAEKYMYQNNIIPFSLRRMAQYDYYFELDDDDCSLLLHYDHLPVLQEDILHSGQAELAQSQALEVDWLGGKITWNEWRVKKKMDTVAGMDIYYPEWVEKFGKNLINNNVDNQANKDSSSKTAKKGSSD